MELLPSNNRKTAYITLVSVIILGLVSITIISAALTIGVDSLKNNDVILQSKESSSVSNACAEAALSVIREDVDYVGTQNLTLVDEDCTFTIIDNGGDGGSTSGGGGGGSTPMGNCNITYNVTSQWSTGFNSIVTIQNLETTDINGWNVGWSFTGNQSITLSWDSSYSQSGTAVSVSNAAYNSVINASGGTVSFGFQASYSTANYGPEDTEITLNGLNCNVTLQNVIAPPPAPVAGNYCQVMYNVSSQWSTGFNVDVVITNISNYPINSWVLSWSFPGNQSIVSSWNAQYIQVGQSVTAANYPYNQTINANNGTVSIGFQAAYTGTNSPLTTGDFYLNGISCGMDGENGGSGGGESVSNKLINITSVVDSVTNKIQIQTSQINPTIEILYWKQNADF
ncbi:cellulose binding domain-containing protein [Candidatus Dojkabacteria bacterium]|uniref:Cellulose binding domain-containing protein n=1 Tax=Candidatus Dojkabacteria bacterium TaxID=2099670 RepID=A0A955LAL0_9BACT|nr:cellulose binding domain-containing protein [Candidatus Dojkabacteria bacterium]